MAAGILGTGITGLLTSKTALATTSQNITNVNTEGYSRQRVKLATLNPQPLGNSFIGNGVTLTGIERIHDQFLTSQLRTTTSGYNELQRFTDLASQVDNVLADPSAGLMPTLQDFFTAIQDVSNDPTSSAARQAMLSSAQSLTDRFNYLEQRFEDLRGAVGDDISVLAIDINEISTAIAGLNRKISEARTLGSGEPNDLLDKRDTLITELSRKVNVSTVEQSDGSINVFIGNGQSVVTGFDSFELTTVPGSFDREQVDIAFKTPAGNVNISDQISGGELGGVLDFRDRILDRAQSVLGHLAAGLSQSFNEQHRLGLDLRGLPGGDFFTDLTSASAEVFPKYDNSGPPGGVVSAAIDDVNALVASDYKLVRDVGGYQLTRLYDNKTVKLANFPTTPATVDGMTLQLDSGSIAVGDSFLISPVGAASREMGVEIFDPASIAAASPIRSETDLANNGAGTISAERITDLSLFTNDTYTITSAFDSQAVADGGATRGVITDNNNDSTLQYELRINNVLVYSQAEGAPPLADVQALADVINGAGDANISQTGVRAYVDTSTSSLYLANEPASVAPIDIDESLLTTAGTVEDGDTVTGYFGSSLSGASSPQNTISFTGYTDSYVVTDSSSALIQAGAYVSGQEITFDGIAATLSGANKSGDQFRVMPNTNGVSDNRNALAMGELQTSLVLNGNSDSYEDVYGRLVSETGITTYQAEINRDAQEGLMNRAIESRDAKSGVNLDEEAANMLRYQQLYQASAQIIQAADTTFNSLMDILRR